MNRRQLIGGTTEYSVDVDTIAGAIMQKTGIDKFNYLYHPLGKSNFYLSVRKEDKNRLRLKKEIKDIIELYN